MHNAGVTRIIQLVKPTCRTAASAACLAVAPRQSAGRSADQAAAHSARRPSSWSPDPDSCGQPLPAAGTAVQPPQLKAPTAVLVTAGWLTLSPVRSAAR